MRLLLREAATRDRAIVAGLREEDDHLAHLALTAAAEGCPEPAIPLVITRAASGANTGQRVAAIRVLGATHHPGALATLLQFTAMKKTLLGARAPSKTPEYLAALTALQHFAEDPRASQALAVAARSRDPEIVRSAGADKDAGK
jgi:hypothetical protein